MHCGCRCGWYRACQDLLEQRTTEDGDPTIPNTLSMAERSRYGGGDTIGASDGARGGAEGCCTNEQFLERYGAL